MKEKLTCRFSNQCFRYVIKDKDVNITEFLVHKYGLAAEFKKDKKQMNLGKN